MFGGGGMIHPSSVDRSYGLTGWTACWTPPKQVVKEKPPGPSPRRLDWFWLAEIRWTLNVRHAQHLLSSLFRIPLRIWKHQEWSNTAPELPTFSQVKSSLRHSVPQNSNDLKLCFADQRIKHQPVNLVTSRSMAYGTYQGSALTLLVVRIKTGRRHQIRSHFAFLQHATVSCLVEEGGGFMCSHRVSE